MKATIEKIQDIEKVINTLPNTWNLKTEYIRKEVSYFRRRLEIAQEELFNEIKNEKFIKINK